MFIRFQETGWIHSSLKIHRSKVAPGRDGRDEILICGLTLSVQGAIGSTYNYLAPLFVRLLETFERGDLQAADELEWSAMKIIKVLIK